VHGCGHLALENLDVHLWPQFGLVVEFQLDVLGSFARKATCLREEDKKYNFVVLLVVVECLEGDSTLGDLLCNGRGIFVAWLTFESSQDGLKVS